MNKSSTSGKDYLIISLRDKNTALEKKNAELEARLATICDAAASYIAGWTDAVASQKSVATISINEQRS